MEDYFQHKKYYKTNQKTMFSSTGINNGSLGEKIQKKFEKKCGQNLRTFIKITERSPK